MKNNDIIMRTELTFNRNKVNEIMFSFGEKFSTVDLKLLCILMMWINPTNEHLKHKKGWFKIGKNSDYKEGLINTFKSCISEKRNIRVIVPISVVQPLFNDPKMGYRKCFWNRVDKLHTFRIHKAMKGNIVWESHILIPDIKIIEKKIFFEINWQFLNLYLYDGKMDPYILVKLQETNGLKNIYSFQFYIWLLTKDNKQGIIKISSLTLHELKMRLGIDEKKYKATQDFQKLLVKIKNDINKNTRAKIIDLKLIKNSFNNNIKNLVLINARISKPIKIEPTKIIKNNVSKQDNNNEFKIEPTKIIKNNVSKQDNNNEFKNEIIKLLNIQQKKNQLKLNKLELQLNKTKNFQKQSEIPQETQLLETQQNRIRNILWGLNNDKSYKCISLVKITYYNNNDGADDGWDLNDLNNIRNSI